MPGRCTCRGSVARASSSRLDISSPSASSSCEAPSIAPSSKALHRASRAANSRVRYVAGSSGLYVLGLVLLAFVAVLILVIVYGFVVGSPPRVRVLAIVPVAGMVGSAFVKQGRAKPYDPAAPPDAFLPPADTQP